MATPRPDIWRGRARRGTLVPAAMRGTFTAAPMPYEIHFTPTGSDLRLAGVVAAAELTAALEAAGGHAYPGGRRFALVDFRDVERIDLTSDDVRAIAARAGAFGPLPGRLAVAVVAPTDVSYGLTRMWEAFVEGSAGARLVESAVFRSRAIALAWLVTHGIADADLPPDPAA